MSLNSVENHRVCELYDEGGPRTCRWLIGMVGFYVSEKVGRPYYTTPTDHSSPFPLHPPPLYMAFEV